MNPRFLSGATWGFPGAAVEHIETHAAHVFLAGNRALKIKKDVVLPYLDFSSVAKRRDVIAREFEINRGLAPDIYVGVEDVDGEPVLVMNRFEARDLLSNIVDRGRMTEALAVALAKAAADAHTIAPAAQVPGADIMNGLGAQLSKAFTSSPDIFPPPETLEFHALYEEALKRLSPLLNRRGEEGLVRRCHGDMHCGNIVVIEGKPILFDAIEFNEKIATIDVLYDLAFLLMDLLRHGEMKAANIVLNRYLDLRRENEDLSGLAALPLFLATRAGVRALVTADLVHELPIKKSLHDRGQALDYYRASITYMKPPRPQLVCIGGFSGTGKSTLARNLAPELGASPGAIHVRSDVERKRLAGVAEIERLPLESYSRAQSYEVYEAIISRAGRALATGHSVILDAVFAEPSERMAAEAIAKRLGAAFRGLWLEANPAILKARLAARVADASDATPQVIDRQLCYDTGPINWERVDASGPPDLVLERARQPRLQPVT